MTLSTFTAACPSAPRSSCWQRRRGRRRRSNEAAYRGPSVPLRKLDRDTLRPVDKNQFSGMKIHNLVSSLEPVGFQLCNFGLDIINGEANMVHADLVQVADVGVWQGMRLLIMQELDLRSRRCILQDQGDMIGLDIRNTHVTCEWLAADDDGFCFLESEYAEERLCAFDV